MEFGRIAFSSHIPSCHSPVSSIPQLPQLVRRGKLLHSGRASSHGFVEQLKLTPFYFCINGPLAIAQFRLFCSSLDSCLCNPTGFKWPPSLLEKIFVPVFLLHVKKGYQLLPICPEGPSSLEEIFPLKTETCWSFPGEASPSSHLLKYRQVNGDASGIVQVQACWLPHHLSLSDLMEQRPAITSLSLFPTHRVWVQHSIVVG